MYVYTLYVPTYYIFLYGHFQANSEAFHVPTSGYTLPRTTVQTRIKYSNGSFDIHTNVYVCTSVCGCFYSKHLNKHWEISRASVFNPSRVSLSYLSLVFLNIVQYFSNFNRISWVYLWANASQALASKTNARFSSTQKYTVTNI